MAKLKLAVIVGSARKDSINGKLAVALSRLGSSAFEASFIAIDDLPLYNQDLEANWPVSATRLKHEIAAADAVLVVTPEHNRSIPALLKNAIDWAARPYGKSSWRGKVVAITGTSPGAIGSAIAQQHLRVILGNLGALVMGGEAYIGLKPNLVDKAGDVPDESTRGFLQAFIDQLAELAGLLARRAA